MRLLNFERKQKGGAFYLFEFFFFFLKSSSSFFFESDKKSPDEVRKEARGRWGRKGTSANEERVQIAKREVQRLVHEVQRAVLLRHPVDQVLTHPNAEKGRGGGKKNMRVSLSFALFQKKRVKKVKKSKTQLCGWSPCRGGGAWDAWWRYDVKTRWVCEMQRDGLRYTARAFARGKKREQSSLGRAGTDATMRHPFFTLLT